MRVVTEGMKAGREACGVVGCFAGYVLNVVILAPRPSSSSTSSLEANPDFLRFG